MIEVHPVVWMLRCLNAHPDLARYTYQASRATAWTQRWKRAGVVKYARRLVEVADPRNINDSRC